MSDEKAFDDNIIEGEEEEGEEIEEGESATVGVPAGEEVEGEEDEEDEAAEVGAENAAKNATEGEEIEGEEEEEEEEISTKSSGGNTADDKVRITEEEGEAPETPKRPPKRVTKAPVTPKRFTRTGTPSGKKMMELNREFCTVIEQKTTSLNTQISKALGAIDTNLTSQVFVATQNTTKNLKSANSDIQKVFLLCAYMPQ